MKPKAAEETAEQKQQRIKAESDNLKSVQNGLGNETNTFSRLRSKVLSLKAPR